MLDAIGTSVVPAGTDRLTAVTGRSVTATTGPSVKQTFSSGETVVPADES